MMVPLIGGPRDGERIEREEIPTCGYMQFPCVADTATGKSFLSVTYRLDRLRCGDIEFEYLALNDLRPAEAIAMLIQGYTAK